MCYSLFVVINGVSMNIQMSFADAYRIRAKRYVISCLIFMFLALLSITYQIQHKTVWLDIFGVIFASLSFLSLAHTLKNYYKSLHI